MKYHEEEYEGNESTFSYNLCQYKAKKESTRKKRMTKKHKPKTLQKPTEEAEVVLEDHIEADMREIAQWNREDNTTTARTAEDTPDESVEVAVINDGTLEEGTIKQAVERFKALEEDLSVKGDVIKRLETELDTSKEAAIVVTAEAASLEDEKVTLKTQLDFFRSVSKVPKNDIKKCRWVQTILSYT